MISQNNQKIIITYIIVMHVQTLMPDQQIQIIN